jgi:hypothetical protein
VRLNVSDYSGNWNTDEMWVNVTETEQIRDVAVTGVTAFPTTVTTGDFLFINVTVANYGNGSETFNVTLYYNSSVVGTMKVISLASGANKTLGFNWDTMGVPGGNYTIKAVASIVAGETLTADNECTGDKVTIKKLSSSIYISASPATITVGTNTTINGSISPIRVEVNVTIYYRLAGENWSVLKNVTTDADGRYSYEWMLTTAGTYEVKAGWEGDDNTLADESNVWSVTVKAGEEPHTEEETATNIYPYAATAAIIIIASATTVYILKVRKPKPTHETREQESQKTSTSACKS